MNDTEREVYEIMELPPEAMERAKAKAAEIVAQIHIFVEIATATMLRITETYRTAAEAIAEAWEESDAGEAFKTLADLLEVLDEVDLVEREKLPRPEKNTINKRYTQPVLAVRRTARSRLR